MYWSSTSDTVTSSALVSRNERELYSEEGSGYYEGSGEGGVENTDLEQTDFHQKWLLFYSFCLRQPIEEGDLAEIISIFIENDEDGHLQGLFPELDLKKAGKRDGAGRAEKRERNKKARWERKQKNKDRKVFLSPCGISLLQLCKN